MWVKMWSLFWEWHYSAVTLSSWHWTLFLFLAQWSLTCRHRLLNQGRRCAWRQVLPAFYQHIFPLHCSVHMSCCPKRIPEHRTRHSQYRTLTSWTKLEIKVHYQLVFFVVVVIYGCKPTNFCILKNTHYFHD